MSQWLKALVALAEDAGFNFQFLYRGSQQYITNLWYSSLCSGFCSTRYAYSVHAYMQAKYTHKGKLKRERYYI